MLTPRLIIALILILTCAFAQNIAATARPIWAPILDPALRESKQILNGQYIFFDPELSDYVLRYISQSTSSDGAVRIVRLSFSNQANAIAVSTILIGSDKKFQYKWSFQNASTSKHAIRSISLATPKSDSDLTCSIEGRGSVLIQKPYQPTGARQIEADGLTVKLSLADSRYVLVSFGEDGYLKPGNMAESITCKSFFLPGWISAYMPAGNQNQIPEDVPQEALDQLGKMLKPEHCMTSTIVFGPKYPPGSPSEIVALDLRSGLSAMKSRGLIEGDAVFFVALDRHLEMIAESPSSAVALELKPTNLRESEWSSVLRIALPRYFK